MLSLLVLRHAKSSWAHPGIDDHERPLNKRGERSAPRMGRFIAERGMVPDRIISSTAVRARSTAEAVARHSGFEGDVQLMSELYLASPDEYFAVLWGLTDNPNRVMVVGHNPGMEELVELITGTSQTMPTAALAHIGLPIDRWQDLAERTRGNLLGIWRPRELPEES